MEYFKNLKFEMIVFSDDWNGIPFSCKHLLKPYLPETPIVWVETIGLRSPKFNVYDMRRVFGKITGWLRKSYNEPIENFDNLTILDPLQIPYNQFQWVRKINTELLVKAINKQSTFNPKIKIKRVILTTWPFLGDVFGQLHEDLSIYYRVDDFSEFPGVNKHNIQLLENTIINKADLVVATSEELTRIPKKSKSRYLPHGVDYDHFSVDKKVNVYTKEFQNIPSPIIGFFGLLNSWINFDLIFKIAVTNPQWSFVFIGPSQLPDDALPKNENIYFFGPKSYSTLPLYAIHFDVGLIPFKCNKLTISVNPLKLLEYFALGLPVVSTALPEVEKYGSVVNIGSDVSSFEQAINIALNSNNDTSIKNRKKIAFTNSWEKKSEQLLQWVGEELQKRE